MMIFPLPIALAMIAASFSFAGIVTSFMDGQSGHAALWGIAMLIFAAVAIQQIEERVKKADKV
jgi:hypothetical protein